MPLYPYTCDDCEAEFEALVTRVTDPLAVECPACGGTRVARGFGVPARGPASTPPATNCRGDGPPCGAQGCGRRAALD